MKKRPLRSGYTTGACAAAAAKAATVQLLSSELGAKNCKTVEIPFPDGSRVRFKIHNSELMTHDSKLIVWASVIKDAGDDPDVTNGAEICAGVSIVYDDSSVADLPVIKIKGGIGVGMVTKPGLSVLKGESAINPVPKKMISDGVREAIQAFAAGKRISMVEVIISVPDGEQLAKKTLNYRLGIVGGISILGTTGIVRPISAEAWIATITSSMDVAKAMGHKEIVLSAGRASEKAHMKKYNFPEESYVMMGDYLEFSLLEAKKHGFKKIHLCAQWAKMLKIAMATPQTHVRHGAIDVKKAVALLINELGIAADELRDMEFNTAREIFDFINSRLTLPRLLLVTQNSELFSKLCAAAKKYIEGISGISATIYLVSYEGDIIASE